MSTLSSSETSRPAGVVQVPATLRLVSAEPRTDRELAERIRAGDVDAFECVFRRYFGALCSVVNGYVESRDVAEELVQDLLLTLWKQRAELHLRDRFRVYLFTAARNRALNWLRRMRREIAWERDAAATAPQTHPALPDAHEVLESRELAVAVGTAIAALPERRRVAFQLTQQMGLSHAETAAVMGIAPKTVAIHLGLARQVLRQRLRAFFDP